MRALYLAACLLLLASAHAAQPETSGLINLANDYGNALQAAELFGKRVGLSEQQMRTLFATANDRYAMSSGSSAAGLWASAAEPPIAAAATSVVRVMPAARRVPR